MKKVIIHIDDYYFFPESINLLLRKPLKEKGVDYVLIGVFSAAEAVEKIKSFGAENTPLVISDGHLLGTETALNVYEAMRTIDYKGKIILFSNSLKKIRQLAEEKNLNPTEMFFAQIDKEENQELIKTIVKILTE